MSSEPDQLVWGCEAIGAEINRTATQANHLARAGVIPARKVGKTYVATRRELRAAVGLDAAQPGDRA
jgi:hypothetical protein